MAETLEQLYAEAQLLLDDILKTEIATWAKGVLREHIWTDIYNAYTPKTNGWVAGRQGNKSAPFNGRQRVTYQRRYNLPRLVYSRLIESGVLFVTSDAKRRPSIYPNQKQYSAHAGSFLELLEGDASKPNGGLGIWAGGFPRPAVSNAQKTVDKNLSSVVRRAWNTRTGQ